MSADKADITIVSFGRFLDGNAADQEAVAKEIYHAFSTVGWVYLTDTGISQERVDEMFALAKTFFDLPIETKKTWALTDPALNQGYTGEGTEGERAGRHSHKECYEHRRYSNPLCPGDEQLPHFRARVDAFYGECLALGLAVLRCLAMAMDLGAGFFDGITAHADPQLRLLHYPAIPRDTLDQPGHARIPPHTDFGLCTLLFQDAIGGLEVDPLHTGDFKPAVPVPGTVLVNIADLLQRLTNGRVRSTRHRVMSPVQADRVYMGADGRAMLPARFSMPFFIHPDPETWIEPITKTPGEVKKWEGVNAGEWRTMVTARNYGLRAPPLTAATQAAAAVAVEN